jgi:hypothetical protein
VTALLTLLSGVAALFAPRAVLVAVTFLRAASLLGNLRNLMFGHKCLLMPENRPVRTPETRVHAHYHTMNYKRVFLAGVCSRLVWARPGRALRRDKTRGLRAWLTSRLERGPFGRGLPNPDRQGAHPLD